jgi:hypothetical protein
MLKEVAPPLGACAAAIDAHAANVTARTLLTTDLLQVYPEHDRPAATVTGVMADRSQKFRRPDCCACRDSRAAASSPCSACSGSWTGLDLAGCRAPRSDACRSQRIALRGSRSLHPQNTFGASGAGCSSEPVLPALYPALISVSSSLLAATMNQKSSLREDPQFVSWTLTGNRPDTLDQAHISP